MMAERAGFASAPAIEGIMRTLFCLATLTALTAGTAARGHYNMLLPQTASAKKGEAVSFTYQWGHPFEHELFSAPKPEKLEVLSPDGKRTDLTGSLQGTEVEQKEGKRTTAWRFTFTPPERGDYVFLLQTPPIWMEEDGEFYQDTVKVVLHVQAQKGWDAGVGGNGLEWYPLTRPYGLPAGTVFQARIHSGGVPGQWTRPGALVEVERYNETRPKELPPDEFITRTLKTDPQGVATTTLPEPGWWCITTSRPGGMREHDGKQRPVRQRSSLWVQVGGR
jgi:cobalt/nickel transport protein